MYKDATIYLDRKYKLYEFFKNGSRSIQEWIEFNESKTANVCDDNAVVNVDSYSFFQALILFPLQHFYNLFAFGIH